MACAYYCTILSSFITNSTVSGYLLIYIINCANLLLSIPAHSPNNSFTCEIDNFFIIFNFPYSNISLIVSLLNYENVI